MPVLCAVTAYQQVADNAVIVIADASGDYCRERVLCKQCFGSGQSIFAGAYIRGCEMAEFANDMATLGIRATISVPFSIGPEPLFEVLSVWTRKKGS